MKIIATAIILFSVLSLAAQENKIVTSAPPKAVKMEQSSTNLSDSQKETKSTTNEVSYPITVSYTSNSKEQKNQTASPRTIEDIDNDIANIKTKIEYVKNSPEMDAKASADGWYDRNEILLKNLEEEKSNLMKK